MCLCLCVHLHACMCLQNLNEGVCSTLARFPSFTVMCWEPNIFWVRGGRSLSKGTASQFLPPHPLFSIYFTKMVSLPNNFNYWLSILVWDRVLLCPKHWTEVLPRVAWRSSVPKCCGAQCPGTSPGFTPVVHWILLHITPSVFLSLFNTW